MKTGRPPFRLTPERVQEIRKAYARGGVSQMEIGLQYGVSQAMVCSVVNPKAKQRAWKHI